METTIITVVLNKIGEIGGSAFEEYLRLTDVPGQVDALRSVLKFWMAWIQTAEESNITKRDELVRVWVTQIRGAVFKAEDIVDEYFQGVYQSRPGLFESRKGGCSSCIPCFSLSEIPLRYDLGGQIKELLGQLNELEENKFSDMRQRVVAQAENIEAFDRPTMGTLAVQQPRRIQYVIGFDDHTNAIASVLLNNKGKRGAIVRGESGIGKTAAARAVFWNWDVKRHFDVCAWVCLPPKSRVDRYLDQIWEQAQEQTHCGSPRREDDVKQMLGKMKLFVVLDGMDNKEELMEVLRELPDGTNGSRIVVTTELQMMEIEQLIHDDYEDVEIKCLEQSKCEEILDGMFSGRCSTVYRKNKKYYDDKIYDISGGLPLGVVLLGGLLYFKDNEQQWNKVFDQLKSFESMRLIKRILTVSYVSMPPILKLCFLYFAAMPPNVDLDLKKLHRLWCAEGIPQSEIRGGSTEKKVLDRCVHALVSLGLVQRVDDDTKVCIHQSVHSFATDIAHETGFMESHDQFKIYEASIVRGLSVRNYDERHVRMDSIFPKLRTLVGDFAEDSAHAPWSRTSSTRGVKQSSLLKKQGPKQSRMRFLCQSKFLRVVDLQGAELGTLPDSIGNMVHLRYLGLRSCSLKDLPPSVAKLLNLETLDITDNEVKTIVDGFWKIEKLKHVLAKTLSLPVSAGTTDSVAQLQTLQGVVLPSQWTQQSCPLANMSKLFSLAVAGATVSNVGPLAKALEEKRELCQLKIQGDRIPMLCSSRYRTLEYLELDGEIVSREGAAQSSDSGYPITAYRIVLRSSCMSHKLLDSFLPKSPLTELELLDNSFSEPKLLLQRNVFTYLKKLKLGNLKTLEELVMEESALPKLVVLEIIGCTNMKTIHGLKYSQELKMVVLFDMPVVVAQMEAEDGELVNKIKHVTSAAWASPT